MNLVFGEDDGVLLIVGKQVKLSEPAKQQELRQRSVVVDHDGNDVIVVCRGGKKQELAAQQEPALHAAQPARRVRFPDDSDDNKHFQTCVKPGCARCRWVRRRKSYREATAMNAAITDADAKASLNPAGRILSQASWCVSAIVDGKWGLGCAACSKLPEARTACSKLRLWAMHKACRTKIDGYKLVRHARTLLHVDAVGHLLGTRRGPTGASVCGAPPTAEFEELLAHMEKGESGRQTAHRRCKTATSTKTTRMRWAVVEAMREKDRLFLKQAVTIVLARDERANRLLVRFSACDAKLNVRRGFMGQTRGAGGRGLQVLQATRKVLKDFCTVNLGVPDGIGNIVLDETLYNHIRSKIEVVVSDSAANEILAADIGRGRRLPQLAGGGDLLIDRNPQRCGDPPSGGDSGNPSRNGDPLSDVRSSLACLTPNLMLIGRDLAHGFRRTGLKVNDQTAGQTRMPI